MLAACSFAVQAAGVYLPREMETKTFEMQSHACSIHFLHSRHTALGSMFSSNSSSNLASKELAEPEAHTAAELLSGAGSCQLMEADVYPEAETNEVNPASPTDLQVNLKHCAVKDKCFAFHMHVHLMV